MYKISILASTHVRAGSCAFFSDSAHGRFSSRHRLLHRFDQLTDETEARITALNTLCKIIKIKLQREAEEAKRETTTLQAKYDIREERLITPVVKQQQKINRKVDETLASG